MFSGKRKFAKIIFILLVTSFFIATTVHAMPPINPGHVPGNTNESIFNKTQITVLRKDNQGKDQPIPLTLLDDIAPTLTDNLRNIWGSLVNNMIESDKKIIQDTISAIYIVTMPEFGNAEASTKDKRIVIDVHLLESKSALAGILAHELSHILLGHTGYSKDNQLNRQNETNADDLAAALIKNAKFDFEIDGMKNWLQFAANVNPDKVDIDYWLNLTYDPPLERHPLSSKRFAMADELSSLISSTNPLKTVNPEYGGYEHKVTNMTFEQTYTGPYEKVSSDIYNQVANYSNTGPGLGERTGEPGVIPGQFTASYSLNAVFTYGTGGFSPYSAGNLTAEMFGNIKGISGRPVMGTALMSIDAATTGGTRFQFAGPVIIYPNGRVVYNINNGDFWLGDGGGKVTGRWEQTPVK